MASYYHHSLDKSYMPYRDNGEYKANRDKQFTNLYTVVATFHNGTIAKTTYTKKIARDDYINQIVGRARISTYSKKITL